MKYIFCGAYEPLLFALHFKNKGDQVTAIVNNESVAKYCDEANINYIEFKSVGITGLTPYGIFAMKKSLKKLIKRINFKEDDVFFLTGKVKCIEQFYLAKQLSKKGKVYYYLACILPIKKLYKLPKYKPLFIRGGILRITYRLFFGLSLIYYEKDCSPCLGVSDEFLKKYNIEEYKIDIPFEQLVYNVAKDSKHGFIGCDNLIIDQGLMPSHVESNQLMEMYKKILKLSYTFTFKKHPLQSLNPEYTSFYEIFKDCDGAPKHIPLEVFLSNVRGSVIAAFSTSLIIASKIPHLKSISLLEMIQ